MANNKHLMTGPERKQLILIPENLNISRGEGNATMLGPPDVPKI